MALIENLAKHMIMLKDGSFAEMMAFLTEAEKHGKDIKTNFADAKHATRTVASEARLMKRMFMRLRDGV
jgi:tetratricopeptide repeat protein 30